MSFPYYFQFQKIYTKKTKTKKQSVVKDQPKRPSYEEEVIREQHWTLFQNDEALRNVFQDDFEDYLRTLDDPDYYETKLSDHLQQLGTAIDNSGKLGVNEFSRIKDWLPLSEEETEEEIDWSTELDSEELENDPLYRQADDWAERLERWSTHLYFNRQLKNKDLFRVYYNCLLVPAKIIFAGSNIFEEEDIIEIEINIKGYQMALIFLERTLESLANFAASYPTFKKPSYLFIKEGLELKQMLSERIETLESKLKSLGDWEYFSENSD